MLSGNLADLSYPTSRKRRGRVQGKYGNISPTLTCGASAIYKIDKEIKMGIKKDEGHQEDIKTKKYRIRKLTPRECGRLMAVDEESINRMLAAESNSQCYKAYGNSIVVSVLCGIFSQLGIQGVKKWNDMSNSEREQIIYKGTILEDKNA